MINFEKEKSRAIADARRQARTIAEDNRQGGCGTVHDAFQYIASVTKDKRDAYEACMGIHSQPGTEDFPNWETIQFVDAFVGAGLFEKAREISKKLPNELRCEALATIAEATLDESDFKAWGQEFQENPRACNGLTESLVVARKIDEAIIAHAPPFF